MNITIVGVGKLKEKYLKQGIDDTQKPQAATTQVQFIMRCRMKNSGEFESE